jgi:hypothetical protein
MGAGNTYLAGRGEMVDYVLGMHADVKMTDDPAYKKNDHFLSVLRSGTLPVGDVFEMIRSGQLGTADYEAIVDGYSGNTTASEGERSDRKRIVSEASYLLNESRKHDAEMQDLISIEGWKSMRNLQKKRSGVGYNYDHSFVEMQKEQNPQFDEIAYTGNANALSYINHLLGASRRAGSGYEAKGLGKLAELYNYLKGGFDDSAGIKTMGELVSNTPNHKLEPEQIAALIETGLGEFEPSHFLKSTLGRENCK